MVTGLVGYYRVSTEGQAEHGLSLDAQRDMVRAYAEDRQLVLLDEFIEVESAYKPSRLTLAKRPELRAALARCRRFRATLVIAALDRLARNVVFVASLIETRVQFVALDIPDATPFMLHIYAAVAEEESRQKSELTRAAIAFARSQGTVWGKSFLERSQTMRRRSEQLRLVVDEIRAAGIIGSTLTAAELNRRKIRFERGRRWSSQTARTLLVHLGYYEFQSDDWPAFRREKSRSRLQTVARIAEEFWRPKTRWAMKAADALNERHIRTGHGLVWDATRVGPALKAARKIGLWPPEQCLLEGHGDRLEARSSSP